MLQTSTALALLMLFSSMATAGSAMSGHVSQRIGILGSTLVYLLVGSVVGAIIVITVPAERFTISTLSAQPAYLYAPGLFNLGLIATQLLILRSTGIAVLSGGLFLGQMVFGLVLDNAGFLGQPSIPLTLQRLLAVAVAGLGLCCMLDTPRSVSQYNRAIVAWGALAVASGCMLSLFTALSAHLAGDIGLAGSTLCFLLPGAILLGSALGLRLVSLGPVTIQDVPLPYLVVPGVINFAQLFMLNWTVPEVGIGTSTGIRFFFRWPARSLLIAKGSLTYRSARSACINSWGCC